MSRTRSTVGRLLTGMVAATLLVSACASDDSSSGPDDTSSETIDAAGAPGDTSSDTVDTAGAPDVTASETDGTTGGTDAAADGAGAEGVNRDATLRIAYGVGVGTLDPHKSSPTITTWQVFQTPIYDRLFGLNAAGEVVPQLAVESGYSEDGTTFEVTLRDDATFHDGSPVNAEAVVANINRGQTVEGSGVATVLEGISAEAVDEFTVVFSGEGLGADMDARLSSNAGMIINPAVFDDPSVDLDTAPPAAAGSGPYVVTANEPSVATSYERSPDYWDPSAGDLASFTITAVPQATTRLQGLQAGDFDVAQMTGDALDAAISEADSGSFDLFLTPSVTRDLFLDVESGDLADPEVRRAIKLGMDREVFDEAFHCAPVAGPYTDDHWAHNPDLEVTYDPDAARQIIADRGGASLAIAYPAGSSVEPVVLVLQEQLTELGFSVTATPVESFPVAEQQFIAGETQAIVSGVVVSPDPAATIQNFFLSGPNLARGEYRDSIEEQSLIANDPTLSQDERAELYHAIFAEVIDEDVLYVPVCRSTQGWGHTVPVVDIESTEGIAFGTPNFSALAVADG